MKRGPDERWIGILTERDVPRRGWGAVGLAGLLAILWCGWTAAPAAQTQTAPSAPAHDHDTAHDATSRHPFDDVERWVQVFESPERAAWQKPEQIPAALGIEPGMVVADVGAGTGYFVPHFAKAVGPRGRVYAVDTEPKMVAWMERRFREETIPNAVAVLGEPGDPKLPAAGVDVIFLCDTYHHIDDRVAWIGTAGRALKPGGRLAVVDFHKRELPVGPPPDHKLAREQVIQELAEAGWILSEESDLLPYQYLLIFTPKGR
jgi:ubiquinone/menaquinone biosynthesis C-methylase UbiE